VENYVVVLTRILVLGTVLTAVAAPVWAQQPSDRLPPVALDLRGAFGRLGKSETTAANFGVAAEQLPARGLGLMGGLHFYPIRARRVALGIGGELLLVRASHQPEDAAGMPSGRAIRRRMESLSGQVSFNFGHRDGWSYVTGGMGPLNFDTYFDSDTPDGLRPMTINYGGGARWFNLDHVAFSVDMRLYATKPANPTLIVGGRKRQTIMIISAGISLR
jgi:hypothetical protein